MPTQILDPTYAGRVRERWQSAPDSDLGGNILSGDLGGAGGILDVLRGMNLNRIPGGENLETQSSDVISGLLNPPTMFADVDRQSAEMGAARGSPGSAGAFGVGLRLTDEERLKRMALGEDFLTKAFGRQPTVGSEDVTPFIITPSQREELDLKRQQLELQRQELESKRKIQEFQSGVNRGPQYFGPLGFTPTGGDFQPAPAISGLPSWMTGF